MPKFGTPYKMFTAKGNRGKTEGEANKKAGGLSTAGYPPAMLIGDLFHLTKLFVAKVRFFSEVTKS